MKKNKFVKAVSLALAAALVFGSACFAAPSPSAGTSGSGIQWRERQYVADGVEALSGDGTSVFVGSMRVSADYTDAVSKDLTLVISPSNTERGYIGELLDQINEKLSPIGYAVDAGDVFDLTLRYSDNSVYMGEEGGYYDLTFGVGNEYDGQTVALYVFDGTSLTGYTAVVSKGKAVIENVCVSYLRTLYLAKPVLE